MGTIKQVLRYLLAFCIGVAVGLCLSPFKGGNKREILVQTDTIIKEVVKAYNRLELAGNTRKIDVPKVGTTEYVWLQADSCVTIYRDSVQYVTLPREYYYTKQDDVEIWHSGIDSRIDSLRYRAREVTITDTYRRKDYRHELGIYAQAGYNRGFAAPVGVQYLYKPVSWFGIGGGVEYDLARKTTAVYAKGSFLIHW